MATPSVPGSPRLVTTNQHWSKLTISLIWLYRGAPYTTTTGFMKSCLNLVAWLVLKGKITVDADGERVSATEGQWMFPKPVPRYQEFSEDAEIISVSFRMTWPDGDPLFKKGLTAVLASSHYPELEQAAIQLETAVEQVTQTRFRDARLADENLDFAQFVGLEREVLGWGDAVFQALTKAGLPPNLHQAGDPRIHAILDQLDRWPLNVPFRASDLAQLVGLSRSNLDRIVVNALGTSSKGYLERRRLSHALLCLENPNIPIKQIAFETGFQHSSSFCAWFKSNTGHAPGELSSG